MQAMNGCALAERLAACLMMFGLLGASARAMTGSAEPEGPILDCNGNAVADDQDIALGSSLDLNANGRQARFLSNASVNFKSAAEALSEGRSALLFVYWGADAAGNSMGAHFAFMTSIQPLLDENGDVEAWFVEYLDDENQSDGRAASTKHALKFDAHGNLIGHGEGAKVIATVIEELRCVIDCVDNEGEPCGSDVNGGCNSTPAIFGEIECGQTICGTSWADLDLRDTDWFRIHAAGTIHWFCEAELSLNIFILNDNCSAIELLAEGHAGQLCNYMTATLHDAEEDTYILWIGATGFSGFPCSLDPKYQATVECQPSCPLDLDGSGHVGFGDLLQILNGWGPCP